MSKIHIFTDADLDGAGCIFLFKKIYKNFTYQVTTEKKFRDDFLNWQLKNKKQLVVVCWFSAANVGKGLGKTGPFLFYRKKNDTFTENQ